LQDNSGIVKHMKRIKNKRKKKQFCINGHNISIVGRYADGSCKECKRIQRKKRHKQTYVPHPRQPKQFCPKGHDTFIVGRNKFSRRCNTCASDEIKKWNKLNPERHVAHSEKWRKNHLKEAAAKMKEWRDAHPGEDALIQKRWRQNHPDLVKMYTIKHETNRLLRVVTWTDWDEINKFERNKPKGMTTDHIIPLQGDLVAGLHVSWNLQYMPKGPNSSKKNKVNLLWASVWYGKILKKAGLK
jgi:hypothetical protein